MSISPNLASDLKIVSHVNSGPRSRARQRLGESLRIPHLKETLNALFSGQSTRTNISNRDLHQNGIKMTTITTPLTKLFGIKHPIFLAGMNVAAGPGLAAAVTNAGGLGTSLERIWLT